ncbi:MAG TPA: sugar ABC transporter permease [Candidatus Limnocylindrales bacterium]
MTSSAGVAPGVPKAKRSLGHRLADRGMDRMLLLLVPGVLFLGLLFVYPFLYGLQLSFLPSSGDPLGNYKTFFGDSYLRDTIWTTLTLGVPAALFNVLVSVPIAYRMRGRFRFKRTITTLLVVPIALGTVLTADGLIQLVGPSGWLNKLLRDFGLVDQPLILIHNYWGVLFSLIITGFPFAFLLVLSYLSGIDPNLERAASVMGAGWWERFRRITFPLLVPGLAITFCLSFVLAFSVFPSANLVGDPAGSTRVISIAAYHAAFEQFDYSMGSAISMIMGAIMLGIIALVLGWRSTMFRGATGGKG